MKLTLPPIPANHIITEIEHFRGADGNEVVTYKTAPAAVRPMSLAEVKRQMRVKREAARKHYIIGERGPELFELRGDA